jgi:hypothetical protein
MYSGYGDDDGMMDSLRHHVRRHKDYDPVADTELSDEDKAIVSIAIFQVAVQDTPDDASLGDIISNIFPSAASLSIFGIITEGINMSPDDRGGGGGRPGSNYAQNRQFQGAVRELESQLGRPLDKWEIRQLHDSIHHLEDPGFWDIVEEGLSLFGKK